MAVGNIFTLGRATVTWNSQDLGITSHDTNVTLTNKTFAVMTDAYAAPVDAVQGGWDAQISVVVNERDYDVLAALDGIAKVIGTGTTGTKGTFGGAGGGAATTGSLTVTSSIASRTPSHDFTLHKAFLADCTPAIGWNPEEPAQKNFLLVFRGMIDSSKSVGDQLGSIGVDAASVA